MEQTITVRADAVYEGYPDVSHFTAGVQTSKPLAEDALSESLAKYKIILEELKRRGYRDEDVAVFEQYVTGGGEGLSALGPRAGFTATIRLSAQTKDFPRESPEAVMKHFAALADAMARYGVDVWGRPDPTTFMSGNPCVRFSFEDFDSIEATLLERAISSAKVKAATVAKSVGKQLTELISVYAVYSDFQARGEAGIGTSKPEKLMVGGKLDAVKGPTLAGYWKAVCRLSIATTFGWA